ncbi:MAG: hypothetical protein AB1452_02660 [Pseudomonadota bacterium]
MPHRFADSVAVLLGVVLAATPLALWIAWTPAVLAVVVAAALASASLLVLLHELAPPQAGGQPQVERPGLPEEFVEEIHRLFPLTYHHSGAPAARYRRAMDKLSRMIRAR